MQTSARGALFIQAKHSLDLGSAATSELGKTLKQFVGQFLLGIPEFQQRAGGRRDLDSARDRLIIAVGPGSSRKVRIVVPSLLTKIREGLPQASRREEMNQEERETLDTLKGHIYRFYRELRNRDPNETEVTTLLSLIRVATLSFENDGESEQAAKSLLAYSIISDPTQAELAWRVIITTCAEYCSQRVGGSRHELQRVLLDRGIGLQGVRSYREDIERLFRYSRKNATLYETSQLISVEGAEIRIPRPFGDALRELANSGGVVVGEAGAGKTAALMQLFDLLNAEGEDVLLLSASRIAARSLEDLARELEVTHPLTEVLENWQGTSTGYLLIDALDAARLDPHTHLALRDLITQVNSRENRWNIVAVVRKFDLRHSDFLRQQFRGVPVEGFADPEFSAVRHVNIGRLSEMELRLVADRSAGLSALIANSSSELLDLLGLPLHLRLAADLLSSGHPSTTLAPIQSQIQLFEEYWRVRVIGSDASSDARRELVTLIVDSMIENREMRALTSRVTRGGQLGREKHALLTEHVLVEWREKESRPANPDFVAFAHQVVFDYAVARLKFWNTTPPELVDMLTSDNDLVISVRPSLALYFDYMWEKEPDHREFWHLVFHIMRSTLVPEIGKLMGPDAAAARTRTLADLQPLFDELQHVDDVHRLAAERSLRHLVNSLRARFDEETQVPTDGLTVWCEVGDVLSRSLTQRNVDAVRMLLHHLLSSIRQPTQTQAELMGATARQLLRFAWTMTARNGWFVSDAIRMVCLTFGSDINASIRIVRRALDPEHLEQYAHEELHAIAEEIDYCWKAAPTFAEEVYRVAFAYQEQSREPTRRGGSQILSFVSTRQQDYEMALYLLAEAYPRFLAHSPVQATSALVSVLEVYALRNQRRDYDALARILERDAPAAHETAVSLEFDFQGRAARYVADDSYWWGRSVRQSGDHELRLLTAFEERLIQLAHDEQGAVERQSLIKTLTLQGSTAFIWQRLLHLGAQVPETLGVELLSLASSLPVLLSRDTTEAASEFVSRIFPHLPAHERERIELTICRYPDEAVSSEQRRRLESIRDFHLSLLPDELLVTDAARELATSLQHVQDEHISETHDEVPTKTSSAEGTTSDARLETPNQEANARSMAGIAVERWTNFHLDAPPTADDVNEILPSIRSLYELASSNVLAEESVEVQEAVWDILAEACERITTSLQVLLKSDEQVESDELSLVRDILCAATTRLHPVHGPADDSVFDTEHPHWGGGAARLEAAQGLTRPCAYGVHVNEEVLEALDRLSQDKVPSVRFFTLGNANALLPYSPDLMWSMLERLSVEEDRLAVLDAVVQGSLTRLARLFPGRVAILLQRINGRVQSDEALFVRKSCLALMTRIWITTGEPSAHEMIHAAVESPAILREEASAAVSGARDFVAAGLSSDTDSAEHRLMRERSTSLLERLVRVAKTELDALNHHNVNSDHGEGLTTQQHVRNLAQLIDDVVMELYAASGVLGDKRDRVQGNRPSPNQKREFLQVAKPLIIVLAEGLHPHTAHHLLEMLEYWIEADPREVFLIIGKIVLSGEPYGYQYESLGNALVVRIVERFFADYRHLLRQDGDCRQTLIDILDVLARADATDAFRLTYRLEEIYR